MYNTQVIPVTITDGVGEIPRTQTLVDFEKVKGICVFFQFNNSENLADVTNQTSIEMKLDGDAKFVRSNTPIGLLYFGSDIGQSDRMHKFHVPYPAKGVYVEGKISSGYTDNPFTAKIVLFYE